MFEWWEKQTVHFLSHLQLPHQLYRASLRVVNKNGLTVDIMYCSETQNQLGKLQVLHLLSCKCNYAFGWKLNQINLLKIQNLLKKYHVIYIPLQELAVSPSKMVSLFPPIPSGIKWLICAIRIPTYSKNVVFIIDDSGSMQWGKWSGKPPYWCTECWFSVDSLWEIQFIMTLKGNLSDHN